MQTVTVQYWEEIKNADDNFWVGDAMKAAVALEVHAYNGYPESVTLTLDREAGTVTAVAS